ncbi:MAG: alpha/beta hydrolase [Planctomycetaceae bacterium]|nr:alpha/beta hydrolase [Planctomycetaceae bacterium]
MSTFSFSALTVAVLLLTLAQADAAEIQVKRNVPYTQPNDSQRRLDIYSTEPAEDRPIMVWIHGGGWKRGDKAAVQDKPKAFLEHGFLFVSINYRFVPEVTVAEMTADVARAIRWVHDHASEFGGNADEVFLGGHSAGAHLAALVCTDESYLQAEGLTLAQVKGCVPVDTAMYDIPTRIEASGPRQADYYRELFGQEIATQRKLSPITHVAPDKGIPPFLILHVADRVDSTTQSQALAKALKQAGVAAKVVPAKGKTHGTINRDLGTPVDESTIALFQFLSDHEPRGR